jgi:enediyne biosynthesis protein E11
MPQLPDVISALNADADEVDRMVAGLDADQWSLPTPAPGWTIAHQIAHLTATFRLAGLAAADPAAFRVVVSKLSDDFDANVRDAMAEFLADPPEMLLSRWHEERATAVKALAAVPADEMVPWLVNSLPPAVVASAGMMELFGHGQDIADTLGIRREPTDRIAFLVAFGVRTRDFGYLARGLTPPEEEFRFELTAPSGALWEYGPADSAQRITGPAADFCLLVTRRRHHADLALVASGDKATEWLEVAQAYRGSAGPGRMPGQFS